MIFFYKIGCISIKATEKKCQSNYNFHSKFEGFEK